MTPRAASTATLGISGGAPKSVSVWVDAATASWNAGTNAGVFQLGVAANNLQDFSLRVKDSGEGGAVNQWRAQFWGSDTDFTVANSADHWVHFAVVYDPNHTASANNITIYANGTSAATGTQVLDTATSGENFGVGLWNNAHFLTGQIDDVAVYNSALTQAQVTALFAGVSPTLVPEPASLGLLALTGGGLLRRRRRYHSNR